jgi:hypothetical protein
MDSWNQDEELILDENSLLMTNTAESKTDESPGTGQRATARLKCGQPPPNNGKRSSGAVDKCILWTFPNIV